MINPRATTAAPSHAAPAPAAASPVSMPPPPPEPTRPPLVVIPTPSRIGPLKGFEAPPPRAIFGDNVVPTPVLRLPTS